MSTLQRDVSVYSKESMLLLDVSALQRTELHLELSTLQLPLLHLNVSRLHGTLLLLNVSTLQRHVMHLDMSTPQGPKLHLDAPGRQEPVLLLELFTPQGPELHQCLHYRGLCCTVYSTEDLSGQQDPTVLLLDVSTLRQGPELHLDVSTLTDARAVTGRVYTTREPKMHLDPRLHISIPWVK
jgi:hypothetical protein